MIGRTAKSKDSFVTVLPAPNGGRVTQTMLYKALYDLDKMLNERFNTLLDALLSTADSENQLRGDFEAHRADGHPQNQKAEIVKEELKLDVKKAAIVAGLITLITAVTTLVINLV